MTASSFTSNTDRSDITINLQIHDAEAMLDAALAGLTAMATGAEGDGPELTPFGVEYAAMLATVLWDGIRNYYGDKSYAEQQRGRLTQIGIIDHDHSPLTIKASTEGAKLIEADDALLSGTPVYVFVPSEVSP